MGAAHCGSGCQSQSSECTLCSKIPSEPGGELETQAFSAVFAPLPSPSSSKSPRPAVEHFDVGHGRFIERHGANYLVVQADNRAMADRIVEEFQSQQLRHLEASVRPPVPTDEVVADLEPSGHARQSPRLLWERQTLPPDAPWKPQERSLCSARPLHTYGSGATYLGQWCGELRHGQGVQEWPNGSSYEGLWVHDRAEGQGRFVRPSGDVYEGQFKADRIHGHGVFRPVAGATYEGQWEDDQQHGHGEEVWPDGLRYVGQFRAGSKSGRGRFTWPNGSTYEGDFEENVIHGFGYHCWNDGRAYHGQWSKEKMHGAGIFTFPDGRCYEGQYVDDLKHGFGMFRWPDGRQYEGQWRSGKQHGFAIYHAAAGGVRAGEWEEGKWLRWSGTPGEGEGQEKLPSLLQPGATADVPKKLVSPRLPAWIKRRSPSIDSSVGPAPKK